MKYSVMYCVLNEERFLPYSLKSIYDFADEIVIVEGLRNKYYRQFANPDGSSTDRTVEIIRTFPDPEKKIRLFQGKWKDKLEMKNKHLKILKGDWVLLVAGDEVYDPVELELLKEFTLKHPEAVCIKFPFIHFIWDEEHQIITTRRRKNMRDWASRHQRYFKNMVGLRYKGSHSDVEDRNGRMLIWYPKKQILWFPKVRIYHYGYCKSPQEIRRKLTFFCIRDNAHGKHGFKSSEQYIKAHPYFSRRGDPRMGEKIVPYQGKKPRVIT